MTTEERNKALTLRGFEEMFNRGDLSVVDELVADRGEDHQEAPGTDFAEHLKDFIKKMRAAFPRSALRGAPHTGRGGYGCQPLDDDWHTRGSLRDRAVPGHSTDRQAG